MVCLTLQWEALTRRSMRTSQTFHPERPRKQIRNKQHRTLQGRRTRHFREQNRTSSRKNTERNNKALARTQTDDTIQTNLKSVDYLDITLNLTSGLFQPYRKPNDEPLYINSKSNHPPKQVHAAINRRLSASSSIKETFDKAKPLYDKALRSSGFNANLHYCEKNTTTPTKRNRKRSIIRFKPPHRKNV